MTIEDMIQKLQELQEKYPEAHVKVELDWTGCLYEGDIPESDIVVVIVK